MPTLYLNGKFVEQEEAKISALDRGFLYGDGLFETIRAYQGKPFRLKAHLERLCDSAQELHLHLPVSRSDVAKAISKLIETNELTEAYIRITLSRGEHPLGAAPAGGMRGTLLIQAKELTPYPEDFYREGMSVVVSEIRQNASSPLPRHKTLNFLTNLLAKEEASARDATEAILLNTRDEVAEGSVSNVFIVRDGKLYTPPLEANILPGITRATVLKICRRTNIVAFERTIRLDDLLSAKEIFLTNSLMEVMPVGKLNDEPVGGRVPGPITAGLHKRYQQVVAAAVKASASAKGSKPPKQRE